MFLQEDAPGISARMKLAIRLKTEEKKVLETCVAFCRQFRIALTPSKDNMLSSGDGKTLSVKGTSIVGRISMFKMGCCSYCYTPWVLARPGPILAHI